MNPQITNLVIVLVMMQASKKIPWEEEWVLNGVRAMYIVSNLLIVGVYLYTKMQIDKKKGAFLVPREAIGTPPPFPLATPDACTCLARTSLTCAVFWLWGDTDMTVLKYVEPAPMGSTEEPKAVTTTVHAYDQAQLRGLFKSQLMGVGMMAVMHLYFKYTNPLLIQSIIPLKGAFEGNLVKVHVLGQSASGDLKRPWKAAGGFGGMMGAQGGNEIKTDKKSIEAAERAGRGGVKDE
nr:srp-independent targeting protein 3 [Quercus suber]